MLFNQEKQLIMRKLFISITSSILLGGIISYGTPSHGFVFSLDSNSSSIDGNVTPDDILTDNLSVVTQGTALGLQDDFFGGTFDILNALSYGQDSLSSPLNTFTVDRLSVGLPETAVREQALISEQGGSIFTTSLSSDNQLLNDPSSLGLTPGFFGDGLNSLSSEPSGSLTYFSISAFSASNGFGTGGLSSDILISDGSGSFSVFADGATMGLDEADDIDSLILFDGGTIGQLDPGIDRAIFSLSSFSPSTFTFTGNDYSPGLKGSLSPADLLLTDFSGSFSSCASGPSQGSDKEDENTGGSGGGCEKVPEPTAIPSLFLVLLLVTLSKWSKFVLSS